MHIIKNAAGAEGRPATELITVAWADAHAPAGYAAAKRALDVVVVLLVLVVGLPIWLLIALLIKLSSAGPVFYRGTVIGRGGVAFRYYKFRTMVTGGDNTAHKQWLEQFVKQDAAFAEDDSGNKVFKVIDDPRITSVGRTLRKLSLDEVPQMLNVLKGDMSLVGPRPPVPYEYEHYDDWAKQRLSVAPGITGLYQVTARSQVGFSGMVAIDLDYIRRRSLWLDVQIMLKTPVVMLLGKGAG
ncbi:MAG TPA: sugar transferase [Anaerolineae bacterium]|nr:sugar transferase [Anaerolineae bacterium]